MTADAAAVVQPLAGASRSSTPRSSTGSPEVDRVLGGGLVPGAVLLLAGEPGIGKSTLVLQLLGSIVDTGGSVLLATGEESLDQVGLRARRLDITDERVRAVAVTSVTQVIAAARAEQPDVLVVDSVQTLEDPALEQSPGTPTQVRGCAVQLMRFAKETDTAIVLVGHVTKDGSVAGPKTLEHLVDAVLTLEGERTGSMRLLRPVKNRFGSCEEIGVFTMAEAGLEAVADPSGLLLGDRCHGVPGSIVFPGLEGTRPLLHEIQALVCRSEIPQPRRVAIGLDGRRLALLLGVLGQRADVDISKQDVFVASAGGLTVKEPAADLPLLLSLRSAACGVPVDEHVTAFGEVGLGGEVRRVPGAERRLAEAARLGFEVAIVPRNTSKKQRGIEVIEAPDVGAAFEILASRGSPPRARSTQGEQPRAVVSLVSEGLG